MSNNLKKSTTVSIVEVDSEKSNLSNCSSNSKLVLNKKDKEREPTQDTSCCSAGCVGKLIASAICGLCFGFLLEKARGKAIEKYNQTFIKWSPFGTKRNTIKPVLRGHIWDKN